MAWWHAKLLKQNRKIKHALWGGLYLVVAGVLSVVLASLPFFACSLFVRKVFFDTALNHYNGRNIFYVSRETTSIVDRIHFKLFGIHSEMYQTVYFLVIVIFNILFAR